MSYLAGIFVGGASRRMGTPKGLLPPPDGLGETLVERIALLLGRTGLDCVVLVGMAEPYASLRMECLADAAPGSGPLAGIVALLRRARELGRPGAVVIACDLPFLTDALVRRVHDENPDALVHCPQQEGFYQPLFARYGTDMLSSFEEALGERRLSLQPLIRNAAPAVLTLNEAEQAALRDWDTPEDRADSVS